MSDTSNDEKTEASGKVKLRKKSTFVLSIALFLAGGLIGFGVTSILNSFYQPEKEAEAKSVSIDAGRFLMQIEVDNKMVDLSLEAEVDLTPGSDKKTQSQVRDVLIRAAIEASEIPILTAKTASDAAINEAINTISKRSTPWIQDIRLRRISEK